MIPTPHFPTGKPVDFSSLFNHHLTHPDSDSIECATGRTDSRKATGLSDSGGMPGHLLGLGEPSPTLSATRQTAPSPTVPEKWAVGLCPLPSLENRRQGRVVRENLAFGSRLRLPGRRLPASATRLHHFGPCFCAAPQRTYLADAPGPEQQRRTGAGSFVWSSAVQDDLAVPRDLLRIAGEILNGKADRPGNGRPVGVRCSS